MTTFLSRTDSILIKNIIEKIRIEMACCCSEHRYKEVNKLLDQLEARLFNDAK